MRPNQTRHCHRRRRLCSRLCFLLFLLLLLLTFFDEGESFVLSSSSPRASSSSWLRMSGGTTTTFTKKLHPNTKPKKTSSHNNNNNKKPICVNRVARHLYHIVTTYEAGISLTGTEVKAIRNGKMNLRDGYIKSNGRTCTLLKVHIGQHSQSNAYDQHEEQRPRQLLLHKEEARKLFQHTDQQPGMTIVPLKAYWNRDNKVKLEIALCRGKNVRDKRADIQQRDAKREEQRIIKSFRVAN